MNKTYVIHWKSKINGRMGTGTTRFEKDEAETLVEELNQDFPDIEHQVVNMKDLGENNPIISLQVPVAETVA